MISSFRAYWTWLSWFSIFFGIICRRGGGRCVVWSRDGRRDGIGVGASRAAGGLRRGRFVSCGLLSRGVIRG